MISRILQEFCSEIVYKLNNKQTILELKLNDKQKKSYYWTKNKQKKRQRKILLDKVNKGFLKAKFLLFYLIFERNRRLVTDKSFKRTWM